MSSISKHIVILSALILLSVILLFTGGQKQSNSIEQDLFVVSDTSQVQVIVITRGEKNISIKRGDKYWTLNDSMKLDQSLIKIINAILTQVRVVRPVSKMNFEEIKSDLIAEGNKITINSPESFQFYAGGNSSKTMTYFGDADLSNIYTVAIPGYNNYLSGIFELTTNQWRDRVLFASSWRTIQSLDINYTNANSENLQIFFDKRMMNVKGVIKLDTTYLMNYLEQFEQFLLNDFLEQGEFPRYDSLLLTKPTATLELIDIDTSKNRSFRIYNKIKNQRFVLLSDEKDQMIVLDENRVKGLMKTPQDFQLE